MRHLTLALAGLCRDQPGAARAAGAANPRRPARRRRAPEQFYVLTDDQITQAPSFERSRADDEEVEEGTCDDKTAQLGNGDRYDTRSFRYQLEFFGRTPAPRPPDAS